MELFTRSQAAEMLGITVRKLDELRAQRKPDVVTEIREDTYREQIWPLPVSELLYVGRATTGKLARCAIYTIGDLARAEPRFLRQLLGVNGLKLWAYANRGDRSRVMPCGYAPEVKSIGHGITCTADLNENYEVRRVLLELSQEVGKKLRGHRLAASGVRVSVRDSELASRSYQARMPFPTQSFLKPAQEGFAIFQRRYDWCHPVRALTISAIDLLPAD